MRKPAVAGSFYAGSSAGLRRQIEECFEHSLGPGTLPGASSATDRHTLGLVSPHAGYIYSGPVASHGFLQLSTERKPQTVVIIGPNHRGLGAAVGVGRETPWQTPLGSVEVDIPTGAAIISAGRWAKWDDLAHGMEHSIEVQVPFLQYIYQDGFKIVPIAMMKQEREVSEDLGRAIASALKGKDALVIASSDFSHYESLSSASRKDRMALEAILDLDPVRLEEVVMNENISMCGPGPVMATIIACKGMGAKKASLLRYATSGDITGDLYQVVGYASVGITS